MPKHFTPTPILDRKPLIRGSITLITGPMFSGKTTELLRTVRVSQIANGKCCVVRPMMDTRWDENEVHTHYSAQKHGVKGYSIDEGDIVVTENLMDKIELFTQNEYDVVAIDEGQFFKDLQPACTYMATKGIHVVVAALNGDSNQKGFDSVTQLYPHCENINMLKAICMHCRSREASFSVKLSAGGPQVDVGGSDKYMAVCRCCMDALSGDN